MDKDVNHVGKRTQFVNHEVRVHDCLSNHVYHMTSRRSSKKKSSRQTTKVKTKTKVKVKTTTKTQDVRHKSTRSRRPPQTRWATVLPRGTFLYKQKDAPEHALRHQFEWFSEIPHYGTSYGAFMDTYQLVRRLTLFDLGRGREFLMTKYGHVGDLCDEQYAGSAANLAFHQEIASYLRDHGYHGTVVREDADASDCGPTEVVLTPETMLHVDKYLQVIRDAT